MIGSTSALRWIMRTHVANRCAMQQPPRAQRAPEPCGASGECRSGALSVQTRERPRRTPASGCERTTARARCTDTARKTDTSSLIASTHRRWHADMSLRDHDSACVTGLSLLDQKGFQAHRRTSPASLGVYVLRLHAHRRGSGARPPLLPGRRVNKLCDAHRSLSLLSARIPRLGS